jgi:cbb3-type cytochrome oxidase subunit 3
MRYLGGHIIHFCIAAFVIAAFAFPFAASAQNTGSPHLKLSRQFPAHLSKTSTFSLTIQRKDAIKDSLIQVYKTGKLSYDEKLKLLLNVYDLTSAYKERRDVAYQILELTTSAHDENHQLEALRYLGNFNQNKEQLKQYLKICAGLKKTNAQREVYQYLRYGNAIVGLTQYDDATTYNALHKLIREYSNHSRSDIYSRVGDLFILCKYLSFTTKGKIYADYLKTLGELIKKLPQDGRFVLPAVYDNLSYSFYQMQHMYKEALEVNDNMLDYIDKLDAKYKEEGRIYRSYDAYRYLHDRRELMMSEVLTRSQIDKIYDHLKFIASRNREAYYDFYSKTSPAQIYYYMAIKDYPKVIPYLDRILEANVDSTNWMKPECLQFRIKAGDAIKDPHMDKYLLMYIDKLEKSVSGDIEGMTKELQTIFDINDFKQHVATRNLHLAIAVLAFLLVFLFYILHLLRVSKKTEASLKKSGEQLEEEKKMLNETLEKIRIAKDQAESANELKTTFLQNMSHDIRTPLNTVVGFSQLLVEERETLDEKEAEKYVEEIVTNGRSLLKIVGDVLESARKSANEIK